ncbi:Plus3 domain-containing protein [Abeliophyllum distichum]|uniref:Plus3 domain-containing protein n=1 Tax=Abeliophyllum distichum TaxID=126358 RepID=A0ABD1P2Z9_9LAMI
MHPFFREVLKDWNLAPCQITPNGWGQMVASYLLWVVTEAGGNLTPKEFESIYQPCRSSGWYNVSPWPGQKCGTATDNPNKVHNWKERYFFVGGDWEFISEDSLPTDGANLLTSEPAASTCQQISSHSSANSYVICTLGQS